MNEEQAAQLAKVTALNLGGLLVNMGIAQAALAEKHVGAASIETLATLAMDQLEQNPRRHHTDSFVRLADVDARREWIEQQDGSVEEAKDMFTQIIGTIIALRDGVEDEEEEDA